VKRVSEYIKMNDALIYNYQKDIIDEKDKEIERLNDKEKRLIRRLEDLIIVGEQVENEWAVDICKMVIKELKGSDEE
jgi:hypothetical protein